MSAGKARRLRYSILAARSLIFPERLTGSQASFLASVTSDELMIGDWGTMKAYDREYAKQHAKYRATK